MAHGRDSQSDDNVSKQRLIQKILWKNFQKCQEEILENKRQWNSQSKTEMGGKTF